MKASLRFSYLGLFMASILIYALEMLCYSGNILSGIIAWNIWRMQEKTHFNKVFMVYFAIDCLIGNIDPYFLFKLYKERLGVLEILTILSLALGHKKKTELVSQHR